MALSWTRSDDLEKFNPDEQTVDEWIERLEVYLELQAIEDDHDKINALLHYSGPRVYTILRQACLPYKPKEKTFAELCEIFKTNFESKPLSRSFRRKLAVRVQESNETVTAFANALRVLASKCDYATGYVETVLVDTFTRNVRSPELKAKFDKAKEADVATLAKCVELARLFESFEEAKQSRTQDVVCKVSSRGRSSFQRGRGMQQQFQQRGGSGGNRGGSRGRGRGSQDQTGRGGYGTNQLRGGAHANNRCYACGGTDGHKSFDCQYKSYKCNLCHKQGHIRRACPTARTKMVYDEENGAGGEENNVEDMSYLNEEVYISKRVMSSEVEPDRFHELSVDKCDACWENTNVEELDVELEAKKLCEEIESDMCGYEAKKLCEEIESDMCGYVSEPSCDVNENNCDIDRNNNCVIIDDNCDVVKCVENMKGMKRGGSGQSLLVRVKVNNKHIAMEIDNGSRHSLITMANMSKLFPNVPVKSTSVRLASLSGHSLYAGGESVVQVFERGREHSLRFIICETQDDFVTLLGREWLDAIVPEWRLMLGFYQIEDESQVKLVKNDAVKEEIEQLKKKYPAVFSKDDSSSIVGFSASVVLKTNCRPVFHKEYMVPYSERERVTTVLRNKLQEERYVRVERSEWASPVWPVPKPHSSEIRVVHDYKRTVNPCIVVDHYPLPLPVDIFNAMRGCRYYCLLDCADAFMQLKLDEKSQEILVLNTCIGLLKPTRLPYGLASASACFQSVIDQVLGGLKKTKAYIDDIIIGGENIEDCRQNLNAALSKLEKHKIRVKPEKMKLYQAEIEILGYVLGHNVYKPSPKKVNAIVNCATPVNPAEVHSYVGMINFYGKFLPQASTVFKPLYDLLAKDVVWDWTERCEEAFELSKQMLLKSKALAVYDPSKELALITDASPVGVGAVLAIREGNEERPIEFMSKMLTITQQKYSQLEREALGVIIALQKFHKYLWGRKFKIVTDNMPLKSMFSPTKTTPKVSAQRLQRWSVILGNYDYDLEYRKSSLMGPADMLSRLPVNEYALDETCNFVVEVPDLPVSYETVIQETEADPQLSAVKSYILKGWPECCPAADLKPYFDVRYALSLEHNCILLGDRVVVPPSQQEKMLRNLHEGHPGMVRMKLRARSIMWWPSITKDIEDFIVNCHPCSQANFKAISTEHVPWTPTTQPWTRIHIDFYFYNNVTYLLCVDSYSKWVEVYTMSKTNASAVIDKLSLCFSTWGLPVEIMSDNGPPFNSVDFIDFCTKNLIVVSKSAPYHPAGNGQAERYVQTVKSGLMKTLTKCDSSNVSVKLSNYLLALRTTPSTVTKKCPCDLMLAYEPKTLVNAIKPNLREYVPSRRQVQLNDLVKVKFSVKHEPFDARVVKIIGPTLLHIERCDNHKVVQVSTNQVQPKSLKQEIFEADSSPTLSTPEVVFSPKPIVSPVIPKPVMTPIVPEPVTPARYRQSKPVTSPVTIPVRSPIVSQDPQEVAHPRETRGSPVVAAPPPHRELRNRSSIQKPERFRSNDYLY